MARASMVCARRVAALTTSTRPPFNINTIRAEIEREHAFSSTVSVPYDSSSAPWQWLDRELSSNMAGETGAVHIYVGAASALKFRGDAATETRQFIEEHRSTEQEHLELFEQLLPSHKFTKLLPIWRAAGFTLGFIPALLSDRALFLTVQAVESFVEVHYNEQIEPLREHGRCPELVRLLEHCCADEIHHKDDAAMRAGSDGDNTPALMERSWMKLVGIGSAVAAEVARRV